MKDCLIIGNIGAITYKEVFPAFKDKKVFLGYNTRFDFYTTEGYTKNITSCWYTTFKTIQKPLILTKEYNETDYPRYDNYNAIEVSRIKDIPYDYEGAMGVPITIFQYDLENVEIVWKGGDIEWAEQSDIFTPPPQDIQNEYKHNDNTWRVQNPYIITNGKPYCPYNRIFIKKTLR